MHEHIDVTAKGKLPYLWKTMRIVAAKHMVVHEKSMRVRPAVMHWRQHCSRSFLVAEVVVEVDAVVAAVVLVETEEFLLFVDS